MMLLLFSIFDTLLLCLTMIGFGRAFMKEAPKDIDLAFGYRTKRSMQNRQTWEFAHSFAGRLWFRMGCGILPLSILAAVLCRDLPNYEWFVTGLTLAQLFVMLLVIPSTEFALRRSFDAAGNPVEESPVSPEEND